MQYIILYLSAFCLCLCTNSQAESVELEGTDGSTLLIQFDSQGKVDAIASSDGLVTSDTPPSQWTKILQKYGRNLKPVRQRLAQLFNFDNTWSDLQGIGDEILPESIFFFGVRREKVATGTEGQFELNPRVRFTAINGVLNDFEHARSSAKMISGCTGGARIHFIYRPSAGWPGDLFGAILTYVGISSPMALHLTNKWRQLIAEMGVSTEAAASSIIVIASEASTASLRLSCSLRKKLPRLKSMPSLRPALFDQENSVTP